MPQLGSGPKNGKPEPLFYKLILSLIDTYTYTLTSDNQDAHYRVA